MCYHKIYFFSKHFKIFKSLMKHAQESTQASVFTSRVFEGVFLQYICINDNIGHCGCG